MTRPGTRAGVVLVLAGLGALGALGCSSSTSTSRVATNTTQASGTDRAFCAAWYQLDQLNQDTSVTDVARHIEALHAIATTFETHAPAAIAPEARRYGAVVAAVAQSLDNPAQAGAANPAAPQLTATDRARLAAYIKVHCSNG